MFAKVFEQIFDSSIAEDYLVRLVFEDLLTLADVNGVVDKTPEALSRRTNVPIDIITRAIKVLEAPDPESRRPDEDGRRIKRLDEHRTWGWFIVNYEYYRKIASEEQRRETTKARVKRFRNRRNADVTLCNDSPSPSSSTSSSEKKEYGELQKVRLTDAEYQKLITKHGEEKTLAAIEILDGYLGQLKKDKYANHYAVLKDGSWVWERVEEQHNRKGGHHASTDKGTSGRADGERRRRIDSEYPEPSKSVPVLTLPE